MDEPTDRQTDGFAFLLRDVGHYYTAAVVYVLRITGKYLTLSHGS